MALGPVSLYYPITIHKPVKTRYNQLKPVKSDMHGLFGLTKFMPVYFCKLPFFVHVAMGNAFLCHIMDTENEKKEMKNWASELR